LKIDDPVVLSRAIQLGRTVLTGNRLHFHCLHRAVTKHCGIVTFTQDPDQAAITMRIDAALRKHPSTLDGIFTHIVKPG
jgi:hypothetical protein